MNASHAIAIAIISSDFWKRKDRRLVEEADDLAGDVLPTGLLVVHNTSGGGQDDVAELTRGQEPDGPLLQVGELDVVAGRDDTSLVET